MWLSGETYVSLGSYWSHAGLLVEKIDLSRLSCHIVNLRCKGLQAEEIQAADLPFWELACHIKTTVTNIRNWDSQHPEKGLRDITRHVPSRLPPPPDIYQYSIS